MQSRRSGKRKNSSSSIEQGRLKRLPFVHNQFIGWRSPPTFILLAMLSYMDGRSVAIHSRINSEWRSELQSCTSSGHYGLDVDTSTSQTGQHSPMPMPTDSNYGDLMVDYGDESGYDMFSTPTDAILYDAFQSNCSNIHSLRSLKLSTARLTKPACELLGQLVYLESIELRLFESVATEWHRDCLTSQQLKWNTESNHPLNHFSSVDAHRGVKDLFVDERAMPALSYTHLHDAAIRSFSQLLSQSLHKLCHLKSITIVSFLDDNVTDASTSRDVSLLYPALRDQSRAIVEAISNHPTLEEVIFVEPRLLNTSQAFHPSWLDTMPNLRSVQVIEAVSAIPVNLIDTKKP